MTTPALPRADVRMLRMWNGICKKVSVARRLDGRLNNLHFFDGEGGSASKVEWQDGLDVQSLLLRRDRLLSVQRDIATAQQIAESVDGDIETRADAMRSVLTLRDREARELDAIDRMLDRLRAESNKHWALVGKILTDVAKLRQTDAHFTKRLELEKSQMDGLTADELAVIEAAKPKDSDD